jgi:steroid delta-isomerase-like uncharacterized protein
VSYTRIGVLQFKRGTTEEAIRRAQQGLFPLFQKEPGFISYQLIKGDGDRGVTISQWDTRSQAETATKQALDWIRGNTADLIQSSDVFVAEVAFDSQQQAGPVRGVEIVQAAYDAFNRKDMKALAGMAAPDAKAMSIGFGKEFGFLEYMQNWATAFPDGQIRVTNFIEQGNRIVAEFIGTGTHTGPLETPMGKLSPTKQCVEMRFADVVELRNGKIAAVRNYFDGASFMQQLGIEPKMPTRRAQPAAEQPAAHH